MAAYYNEHDPYAAQWLRNLIAAGEIADGEVDERSIDDVCPDDLRGFVQCHFFAGIGGWSVALRLAGWPDERPVWTGSCPCQPFSVAGAGGGLADERHLWPAWFWLIAQRRPGVVFGEQVEAAIRHGWLDLVQSDLEGIGYACGAAGLPAAGVGAPHIRQRLWFVADADLSRLGARGEGREALGYGASVGPNLRAGVLAGAPPRGLGIDGGAPRQAGHAALGDATGGVAHASRARPQEQRGGRKESARPSTAGLWSASEWLPCRDGKARPVEPGTFPLAHGLPARVGRLRAYGNAIVPQVAAEMIAAYMEGERP